MRQQRRVHSSARVAGRPLRQLSTFVAVVALLASALTLAPQFAAPASATTDVSVPLAAGSYHTCAVTADGGAQCWGYNFDGELGIGTNTGPEQCAWDCSTTPVDVSGLTSGVRAVSTGETHSCALTDTGGVKCWGGNALGQLGNGTNTGPDQCQSGPTNAACSTTPVDVSGLSSGVRAIATGYYHSCALTNAGGVKCWGDNTAGQVGNGVFTTGGNPQTVPASVSGLSSGVRAITAGLAHTCAVTATGGAKCWGDNVDGELGNGAFGAASSTPVDVSGLSSGVIAIAAGYYYTCALMVTGGVKCWGSNSTGQLGDGTTNSSLVPVNVSGLSSGVVAIALDDGHTCALMATGGVKCWGDDFGDLGDGDSSVPVDVAGLGSGVTAIAVGGIHVCASLTSGAVKCWGDNANGQLGNGTTTGSAVPVDVGGSFYEATAPEPPTGLIALPVNGSASVSFTFGSDGGTAISSYTMTCESSDGGVTATASSATSPIIVSGLSASHTYTCAATATNLVGTSASSPSSNSFVVSAGTVIGACAGQVALGTLTPVLSDVTQVGVVVKTKLLKDLGTKATLAGDCSATVRPGDPIHPAGGPVTPLTPKAMSASLAGNASCASAADDPNALEAWPLNGKVTWTMTQLNDLGKPYQIQADVSFLGTDSAGADVVDVGGIVLKGVAVGARVSGSLWEEPVTRTGGSALYNTGYDVDVNAANACSDGTPGNASISTVMLGGGGTSAVSPLGNVATGITFSLGQ